MSSRSTAAVLPGRARFATWLGPALLVLVASVQRYHVQYNAQSTWLGGGFGMYASLTNLRFARVSVRFGDRVFLASIPEWIEEGPVRRVRVRPEQERLHALARTLLDQRWLVEDAPSTEPVPAASGRFGGRRADEVRVTLYERTFDARSALLRAVEIGHATAVR